MKRRRYLIRAGGYLFFVLFGIATISIAIFIITITGGNIDLTEFDRYDLFQGKNF